LKLCESPLISVWKTVTGCILAGGWLPQAIKDSVLVIWPH
jgi:hypothetical protein